MRSARAVAGWEEAGSAQEAIDGKLGSAQQAQSSKRPLPAQEEAANPFPCEPPQGRPLSPVCSQRPPVSLGPGLSYQAHVTPSLGSGP